MNSTALEPASCYFIVCPAPVEAPYGLVDQHGYYFYVTFGDGRWDTSGHCGTNLPSFTLSENHACVPGCFYIHKSGVNAGTYLKKGVFEAMYNGRGLTQYMNSEWFEIRPAYGDISQLGLDLIVLGDYFENAGLGYRAAVRGRWENKDLKYQRSKASWALTDVTIKIRQFLENRGHY